MGKKWWYFAGAAIVIIIIFLLAGFPPGEDELLLSYAGWSKYSAVTLPANFARELPFPVPTAILSLVTWQIPTNLFWFRFPNLVFSLAWLAVITLLAPAGFGILAVTCLGVVWVLMSDFPAAVTLFLVTAVISIELKYRDEKKKIIWLGFLNLWLSLTSFPGWIFAAVFAGVKLLKKDFRMGLVLLAVVIYAWFTAAQIYWQQNAAGTALSVDSDLTAQVNQRVQNETKLNRYREPLPLFIKRFVYNKPYFALREAGQKIVSLFSFEKMAFPGQGDATVARNLWGSKSLPWMFFWQIPLILIAVYFRKNISRELKFTVTVFGAWGILSMISGKSGDWLVNGIGFFVASLLMISWLISRIKLWGKIAIAVLLLVSVVPSFYHFLYHEEVWRDNRPLVYSVMAQMAAKYKASQVTTILGRSFLYYGWMAKISPKQFWQGAEAGMKISGVKFDHFEKPATTGVYVGLPGEFLGNRAVDNKNEFRASELPRGWELLESAKIRDTVSFGNGDYVWAVKIK